MDDVPPISASARCPRCRYDQRGHVSTWRDSCPLTGRCTECGLEFNWSEVLLPEKFEPHWCVEFVPRVRSVPWASVKTFVRSFWPWTFWSRLKMSQPNRPWRLVTYPLCMLLPIVLLYVALQSTAAVIAHTSYRQEVIAEWQRTQQTMIPWLQDQLRLWQDAARLREMGNAPTPDQLKGILAPPGWDHGMYIDRLRAAMNSIFVTDENLDTLIADTRSGLAALQARSTAPPVFSHSLTFVVLEAVVLPLRQMSSGSILYADQTTVPDLPPIAVHDRWITDYVVADAIQKNVRQSARGVAAGLLLLLLLPLSFILLPASRRRAKVRWPHIWRIVAYSAGLFMLMFVLLAGINVVITASAPRSAVGPLLIACVSALFWIVLPTWWSVAIKRYVKMPHAALVAGVLTFMIALMMGPWLLDAMPYWLERMLFA